VDDEDLREAMSLRGLGTPATRAQIIEGLLLDGYLVRQARDLIVTQKGLSLINLLRGIGVESLTSPEMTGEWEFKLKQMERGEIARDAFMQEIRRFTGEIVGKAKNFHGDEVQGQFTDLEARCPKCGEAVFRETFKAYECRGCGLHVWKNMAGRELERDEVKTLLETRKVGPLEGFRSKLGRPFAAEVMLGEDFKQAFNFPSREADAAPRDFASLPVVLEKCPACGKARVHDAGNAYICAASPQCGFRIGKVICQREIPADQVVKLAETGKTDLIPNFISKKGKPFRARLALDGAKVIFEFEPRAAKPRSSPRKKAG
jgi:DNA topoisomerase-3